jgi:hypothetical protein
MTDDIVLLTVVEEILFCHTYCSTKLFLQPFLFISISGMNSLTLSIQFKQANFNESFRIGLKSFFF